MQFISKGNPFETIWTRPRETVRRIISENPDQHVYLLACLAGVGETLDRASMRNAGDHLPLGVILAIACIFGPLGGLIMLWISSHLIRWTGLWIGGTAVREHVRTALAWSSVPTVFALVFWIPELLLFGRELFTSETPRLEAHPALWFPFLALMMAELVFSIWSIVLLCHTVAEVQGFRSAWRGLGNVCLAVAIVIAALVFLMCIALVASTMFR